MSLADVIDSIRTGVALLTPRVSPGVRFMPCDLADPGVDVLGFASGRAFDVVSVGAPEERPYVVHLTSRYAAQVVAVRLLYSAQVWPRESERSSAAATDYVQVLDKLRNPATWSTVAQSVQFLERERVNINDESGRVAADLVELRFIAEWEETA